MDNVIKKDLEEINRKLDLIIQQNKNMQNLIKKITVALPQIDNAQNYSKAVEEFLNNFINDNSQL